MKKEIIVIFFQSKDSHMPLLINGFIEPHFGMRFDSQVMFHYFFPSTILDMISRIPIIFELDRPLRGFLQLEVEAIKLFDSIIRDLHVTID
jgi:hypothetical protein